MPKSYSLARKLSDFLIYTFVIIIGFIVRHIPKKSAIKMGSGIGNLAYALIKKRRQIALKNLRMVFKEKSDDEIENIAKQSFQSVGKTFVELLRFPMYSVDQILKSVVVEGAEHLEMAINSSKGVLIVTGHFGNWELIFHVLASYTDKLSAVAQRFKNHRLDRLTNTYRIKHGGEIIEKSFAGRKVLMHLNEGFCVVILGDQDAGESGVFIDFMGVPASVAKGPIMFGMRAKVPILSTFDIRQDDGSHVIKISEPLEIIWTGDLQADLIENTKRLNLILENLIYEYPSQWLWMHNRWKTRPKSFLSGNQ